MQKTAIRSYPIFLYIENKAPTKSGYSGSKYNYEISKLKNITHKRPPKVVIHYHTLQ